MKKMLPLNPDEIHVIQNKGTEKPFSGKLLNCNEKGTYICRACGSSLYTSEDKFTSACGWPSFDDSVAGAVQRSLDADGVREEITCAQCGGHLGHVFEGEGFTSKNTRHCVNSVSLDFVPEEDDSKISSAEAEAIFGGGCFWGLEYLFSHVTGVVKVISGYSGGRTVNPTYEEVCGGLTGHAEVVKVIYNPAIIDYISLAKLFFEFHDPTQKNRQGPDIGTQYRSVLFYDNEEERKIAVDLIDMLKNKGITVATEVTPKTSFYPAEAYHQHYLQKHPQRGCHLPVKRFD